MELVLNILIILFAFGGGFFFGWHFKEIYSANDQEKDKG